MSESISQSQEQIDTLTASSIVEIMPHVLKHGDSFVIIDQRGNISPLEAQNHGLFRDGTRFLSRLMLTIGDMLPIRLSSSLSTHADYLSIDAANPHLHLKDTGVSIPQDTIHIRQQILLWENTLYTHVSIRNYGTSSVSFPLRFGFDADYKDIFEVRGLRRKQRGKHHPAEVQDAIVKLGYVGLDAVERQTHIVFSPQPMSISGTQALYNIELQPGQQKDIFLTVACRYTYEAGSDLDFHGALKHITTRSAERVNSTCEVETSNPKFNDWIQASQRDLFMLLTETEHGLYPYAGVPWFSTVFGRDGIITALQMLWLYPQIARGVLRVLAAKQASSSDPIRDAEPGKILHEQRPGEMANTGEIPFGSYYGTIDATPLFLVLAGRYYQRTGDRSFMETLWQSVEAALHWIDNYGDIDGDGFVEYQRKNESGILQQGWKDSNDSVFYEDGNLVEPPVALCEVQGYVFEAKSLVAEIADALGKPEIAQNLREQAAALREKFLQAFWLDDLGTYAIALDGGKRPCRIRTSNAGHCLYSGIADAAHAKRITEQFLSPDFFSGWGIRTLAAGQTRYNPMAYHNGSVWPHDNALIAQGMARYGFKEAATQVLNGLFETSQFMDLYRLPELFCGFERRSGEGPTQYPVACLPQAWASGSVYLLLQACLGIRIDAIHNQVILDNPILPVDIQTLHIRRLPVGDGYIDLIVEHGAEGVDVKTSHQTGIIEVIVNANKG